MNELIRKVQSARDQVQVHWDEPRARRVAAGLQRKQKRQQATRMALAVSATVLSVCVFGVLVTRTLHPSAPPEVASSVPAAPSQSADPYVLRLSDGSLAMPLTPQSQLETSEQSPNRVRLRLRQGVVRFEVVPNPTRSFEVQSGLVTVRVVGTVFSVMRSGEQVSVQVERGRVHVSWAQGETELGAGQSGQYPAQEPVEAPRPLESSSAAPSASVPAAVVKEPPVSRWRDMAEQGQYVDAFNELARAGKSAVRSDPADLMLAADVARLSGHSEQAVSYLRAVGKFGSDPRAPLAAFSLGRVLLEELGRPSEAASAFAQAQRLAPGGELAEDALAREVEALSKAGQSVQARERASDYVERYPNGRRLRAVRLFGGLE